MSEHIQFTDEDLARLEAICGYASPGPWNSATYADGGPATAYIAGREVVIGSPDDALFISMARRLMPALIAEVKRLRGSEAPAEAQGDSPALGGGRLPE